MTDDLLADPADGPVLGDAFGQAMLAHLEQGDGPGDHVVERDDGWTEAMRGALYFQSSSMWTIAERDGLTRATGRVLDVGAGAGRHALWVQARGHDVVALDVSPTVLEVCRRRGVRETFLGTVAALATAGADPFDAFILMGNNLGLMESADRAGPFLSSLGALAKPGAVIVGAGVDPYATTNPDHLRYHERNRDRGRMPGQIRLRLRWQQLATGWFDYLFTSLDELQSLAAPSGWTLEEHFGDGPAYIAILRHQG